MQLVKGVEKTLLGLFFAPDELYIVDKQHADAAVLVAEIFGVLLPYGRNELIGELLGAYAYDVDAAGGSRLSDGVQQVSLAETDPAVNK